MFKLLENQVDQYDIGLDRGHHVEVCVLKWVELVSQIVVSVILHSHPPGRHAGTCSVTYLIYLHRVSQQH